MNLDTRKYKLVQSNISSLQIKIINFFQQHSLHLTIIIIVSELTENIKQNLIVVQKCNKRTQKLFFQQLYNVTNTFIYVDISDLLCIVLLQNNKYKQVNNNIYGI